MLLQAVTSAPADIDAGECAGHGVEARRKDQVVELIFPIVGPYTVRRDAFDPGAAHIDQSDVASIEGRVVIGVEAGAFAAVDVLRHEGSRRFRIRDDLSDLVPHELRDVFVRIGVRRGIPEGNPEAHTTGLPTILVDPAALLLTDLEGLGA